jgi:polysaccharide biosynthesis protein PslH
LASSAAVPDRLRILTLAARPFYPADTGGRIRSSQIFERLSHLHDVTMLCFRTPDDSAAQIERMRACCARLEPIHWTETTKFTPQFYAELAATLPSPLPYTVRKYRSAAMRDRVHALLASNEYDLVLCDFLQPSINCINEPFGPKVLFQHNVEAVIQRRQAVHAVNPLARAYLRLEAAKLARYERRAADAFDCCIMVSDQDCRTMQTEYGATNTAAVPTGVDVDYFAPVAEGTAPEVVFVGSMDWLPNQDAAAYFIQDILPRIRQVVSATFTIVGRNPPESLLRQAAALPYLHVTGTVDDVRPHVGRAQVCVVPLRIGGGTRIKIFEAMAMQKPVVSTSIGAEGLPVTHGDDILLADDAQEFAEHVIRLLQDGGMRRRVGETGRRLVSSRSTWDAAAERFSEICVEAVRRHRTTSPLSANDPLRKGTRDSGAAN